MMLRVLKFENIQGDWFIDLPGYIDYGGNYADLQMVLGADTMLDVLADNDEVVTLEITTAEPIKEDHIKLVRSHEEAEGYWYTLTDKRYPEAIWLCNVTYFVFGEFPETIYISRHDRE